MEYSRIFELNDGYVWALVILDFEAEFAKMDFG